MTLTSTRPTLTTTVDSPIGPLTLTAVDGQLTGLHMVDQAHAPIDRSGWIEDPTPFREAGAQLVEYFAGRRTEFDLPLRPVGTDFQRRVWEQLCRIPFGETRSYAQLADMIGNPRACRAVGLANGRNPIGIVIPCHRVIGANGSLTGYGGGLPRKAFLLDHESQIWVGHGAA